MKPLLPLLLLLAGACTPVLPQSTPTTTPQSTATAAPESAAQRWIAPAPTRTTGCHAHDGLPDAACTPGATDPRVTQATIGTTICVPGYSAQVRPSSSVTDRIKRDEMPAYGFDGLRLADVELDHLVSIELGGAPSDVANLWPEAWNDTAGVPGAHTKDVSENRLHTLVCNGSMPLAEAQRRIATDWRTATVEK